MRRGMGGTRENSSSGSGGDMTSVGLISLLAPDTTMVAQQMHDMTRVFMPEGRVQRGRPAAIANIDDIDGCWCH